MDIIEVYFDIFISQRQIALVSRLFLFYFIRVFVLYVSVSRLVPRGPRFKILELRDDFEVPLPGTSLRLHSILFFFPTIISFTKCAVKHEL